ncbi:MAG: hypothetical protein WC852_06930 [Candidatus Nanoarchaeia archaeon]|jgi:hypothetical protein
MNKTTRKGLGAIVGLVVAGLALGTEGCAPAKQVYDIPRGECRQTTCGEVCYNGIMEGMINADIEERNMGFPLVNRLVYVKGCEMPVLQVNEDLLVIKNWQ